MAIALANGYNDHVENTLLTSTHFPMVSIVVLAVLVLGVNAGARRWGGRAGLDAGELLLIWGMLGVAGGIASCGLMRYFPPWMVMPAYYASAANGAGALLLRHAPEWLLVSRDPASPAVRWFMEGLPRGQQIPWHAWAAPLAVWGLFAVCFFAAMFAAASMFYGAWAGRERLLFPLVQLPLELARPAPPGRAVNEFLRRPLLWAGVAVPLVIHGSNGLRTWFPGWPAIPLAWPAGGLFPDRPWSEFSLGQAHVFFSVIGLTFLLPADLSFSLWFFHVLFRLSFVWVAWLGSGATGFWSDWPNRLAVQDTAGATYVMAGVLLWSARGAIRDSPPAIRGLAIGGVAGMVLWMTAAGAPWWMALFLTATFLAVLLVLSRVVAETGFLVVAGGVVPTVLLAAQVPAPWISGPAAALLLLQRGVFMQEYREILLPFLLNGLRACDAARLRPAPVLLAFALAAGAGLGVSAYGRIVTSYKYGAVNMDFWQNVFASQQVLGEAANARRNPAPLEWVRLGGYPVVPVAAAHVGTGAAAMGALILAREWLPWWPLLPIALIPCTIWVLHWGGMWFSLFLGGTAKAAVMRFGGATAYRRVLPLFLGLALGEFLMAGVFTILGLVHGRAPASLLP